MAEAVLGATIQVLLEKLLTMSQEESSLFKNFKKDSKNLQETISTVKDLLGDEAVKDWLRRLEDLAFKADNVLDDISYHLLSKKVRSTENKTPIKKVKSFFSCSCNDPTPHRLKLGHKIKDIDAEFNSINQQAAQLGLQSRLNAQPPVFECGSFSADPVYGRENDVSTIVEKLITTTPSPAQQVLSVLPIVGMGGLGKTTLARKVFSDEQIISHFGGNRVWVHVPRIFDVDFLFERIQRNLTSTGNESDVPQGNREAPLKNLIEHLGAKKYLLVLDDIWNEDWEMWDCFINSLSGISSATGNCIIVTTRSQRVASIVSTLPNHELGYLSGDDCWSIIKATAFISSENVPMEIETVGRHIAKKCQGLPLAAKVVGGILRGKPQDIWQEIENNWLSNLGDDENTISKVLKPSFDHLSPPSLKICFAYCSIFRKGYQIEKEQLIELWMAEGFLQTETTGNEFFNLLLQNSLLQFAESDDYGYITHYYMNDLVHDLAWSVLRNNYIRRSRYIGYKLSGDGLLSIPERQERYVRTLFFNGDISNIQFSDFESLHSLTLVGRQINELPTSIRELKYLRYLDISETSIKDLPDSVGELYHLRTLREKNDVIRRQCYLEKLPDSLSCLRLRHLHISEYTKLPPDIGKLTSLQTLPFFHVGREKGCRISELGSLKYIKGKLVIRNLERVCDKNEAKSAYLLEKEGIYELSFVWDKSRQGDEANDESVLEGLQPHPNLKGLKIYGFKGKSLPLWANVVFLALERLELCGVQNLEWNEVDLPPPSQLFPRLKYLRVEECKQLTMAPSHFPCLEELVIDGMEKLEIRSCPMMTRLIPRTGGWHNIIVKAEAERNIVFSASRLRQLNIYNCSSLRELPDDLRSLDSLEVLKISGCPNLKSIPYPVSSSGGGQQQQQQQQGFTSLRSLAILDCEGLSNLKIEMVESYAASLEELELSGITNLGMVIGCLHKMTRLRVLSIKGVPEFSIIGSLSTNNSLQELKMGPSLSWNNNVSFNETVDAMLPRFVSLRNLRLSGKEHWGSLPDQLQHLTSLKELYLHDFGIEALPELFGNLSSSLKELHLLDCKKLRHLPSKECLSNLTLLEIKRCPLLLKEKRSNNDDDDNNNNNYDYNYDYDYDYDYDQIPDYDQIAPIDDSEWPKISHIHTIIVDGYRRFSRFWRTSFQI